MCVCFLSFSISLSISPSLSLSLSLYIYMEMGTDFRMFVQKYGQLSDSDAFLPQRLFQTRLAHDRSKALANAIRVKHITASS